MNVSCDDRNHQSNFSIVLEKSSVLLGPEEAEVISWWQIDSSVELDSFTYDVLFDRSKEQESGGTRLPNE